MTSPSQPHAAPAFAPAALDELIRTTPRLEGIEASARLPCSGTAMPEPGAPR